MTLLQRALSSPYTQASFQTLTRHAASPRGLDTCAALRLLRRNVRDVSPHASRALQWSIARQLLTVWRNDV